MPISPTGFVAGNAAPRSVGGEWLGSRDPRIQKFLEALLSGRMLESPEGGDLGIAAQNLPIAVGPATARAPADIAPLLYQHTGFNPKNAAQQLTKGNPLADIAGFAMNQMADPTGSGLAKTIGQSPMVTGALDRLRGMGLDEIITGLGEFGTENPDVMHAPLAMGAGFLGKKAAREAAEEAARLRKADLLNPRKDPYRTRTPDENRMILEQANYPSGSSLKDQPTEVQRAAQQSLARQGFSPGAQVQWKDANVPEGEVGRVTITPEGNIIAPMSEDASGLREGWNMGVPTDIEQAKKLGFDFPGKLTGQVDEISEDIIAQELRASDENFIVQAFNGGRADISQFDPGMRGSGTGASSAREGFFFSKSAETGNTYVNYGKVRPEIKKFAAEAKVEFNKEMARLAATQDKLLIQADDIAGDVTRQTKPGKGPPQGVLEDSHFGSRYVRGALMSDEAVFTEDMVRGLINPPAGPVYVLSNDKLEKLAILRNKFDDITKQTDNLAIKHAADENLQGQNMMSVKLRMENPMVYDFAGDGYRDYNYTFALEEAKKMGFDSAIFRNTRDGAGIDDIYVIFDPENIRSTSAAFKELPPSRTQPYALGSLKKQERKKFTAAAYKERADKIAIELEEKYKQLEQQAGDISTGAGYADWEARRGVGSGRKLVAEYEDLQLVADGFLNAYVRELDNTQLATRIADLRTIPKGGYKTKPRRPLTKIEKQELEILEQHRDRRGSRRPATSTRPSTISPITRQRARNEALDEEAELGRKVRERPSEKFPDWSDEDIKNIKLYDDFLDKLHNSSQADFPSNEWDKLNILAVEARQKIMDSSGIDNVSDLVDKYSKWSSAYGRSRLMQKGSDFRLQNLLKIKREELTDPTKNLRDLLGYDISDIEVYPLSLDPQQLYNAQAA
jgi:hypothetical protein